MTEQPDGNNNHGMTASIVTSPSPPLALASAARGVALMNTVMFPSTQPTKEDTELFLSYSCSSLETHEAQEGEELHLSNSRTPSPTLPLSITLPFPSSSSSSSLPTTPTSSTPSHPFPYSIPPFDTSSSSSDSEPDISSSPPDYSTPSTSSPSFSSTSTSTFTTTTTTRSSSPSSKPPPTVFFDFDGTVVPTDSQHVSYYFIWALPNPIQRYLRLILFSLAIGFIGLVDIFFGETLAVYMIVRILFTGLTLEDAAIAVTEGVTPKLKTLIRPAILLEIQKHQQEGRRVAILSGNLTPLIKEVCDWLDCDCLATELEIDEVGERYTGKLIGKPCVREAKVDVILQAVHGGSGAGLEEEAKGVGGSGVGERSTTGTTTLQYFSSLPIEEQLHQQGHLQSITEAKAEKEKWQDVVLEINEVLPAGEEEEEYEEGEGGTAVEARRRRNQKGGLLTRHKRTVFPGLYGYGNSVNDLFFLEMMEHPFAVTPDRELATFAVSRNWSRSFFQLAEPARSCCQFDIEPDEEDVDVEVGRGRGGGGGRPQRGGPQRGLEMAEMRNGMRTLVV